MADAPLLEIRDLEVSGQSADTMEPERVEILKGVSLTVGVGEVHALVGPSGSGKSTLAAALLGSPKLQVTAGSIRFQGDDITAWSTDVRAKAGLFLAFQNPQEISGVSTLTFLRQALSARKGVDLSVVELRHSLLGWMEQLGIEPGYIDRHVNSGFSADERKCSEILHLAMLEPLIAVLDETDSALSADTAAAVANGVNTIRAKRPELAALVITNDPTERGLSEQLRPDHVHVMVGGRIVTSGGPDLAVTLETDGHESVR